METKDINKFVKTYSTRIVNGEERKYYYNIDYIPHTDFISIEIKDVKGYKWAPSDNFLLEIAISEKKKSALFKKIVSKIYLEEYPIKNPLSAKQIIEENQEYFLKLLSLYKCDLDCAIQSLLIKSKELNGIHYMYKLETLQIQRSINSDLNVSIRMNSELIEDEIVLLNKLLERYKYKILLNRKIKSKYEL